ncbi:MAG: hypothetical protein KatS3mg115_0925 [Candidatus Poribacteria bacterium]|nr:MAG: hypothetical protein KatS3mg115_0925 [Candidatus Poribacteria bacterium]
MLRRRRPQYDPVVEWMRRQEMELRRERRMLRILLERLEGVAELREFLLKELQKASPRTDPETLREALYFLGLTGEEETFDTLVGLTARATEAGGIVLDRETAPWLSSPPVRADFYGALGLLGQRLSERDRPRLERLTSLLREGVRDEHPDVRAAAATALGRAVKHASSARELFVKSVPAVVQLLSDPSWQVRCAAVWALAEIPHVQSVRALKELAERSSDPHLRQLAEMGVQKIRERASYLRYLGRSVLAVKSLFPKLL